MCGNIFFVMFPFFVDVLGLGRLLPWCHRSGFFRSFSESPVKLLLVSTGERRASPHGDHAKRQLARRCKYSDRHRTLTPAGRAIKEGEVVLLFGANDKIKERILISEAGSCCRLSRAAPPEPWRGPVGARAASDVY